MRTPLTILWLRRDLRLDDHPALCAAVARGRILPVFVLDAAGEGLGRASRWWLHHALRDMGRTFKALGIPFVLRRGWPADVLLSLVRESGADAVFWSRAVDPSLRQQEQDVQIALDGEGVLARGFPGALLFEPEALRTASGSVYRVFTPFSKRCFEAPEPVPYDAPKKSVGSSYAGHSEPLAALELLPQKPDWAKAFPSLWLPTCEGAALRLREFIRNDLHAYKKQRDFPAVDGTSRLSPFLAWGQVGPRRVFASILAAMRARPALAEAGHAFLRQLLWREFCAHLLAAFPTLSSKPLQPSFQAFPWREDRQALRAWQKGLTGFPLVDAGMRQLWQTGWMHNRVRMIVGSFLVKDLLLPWRAGEAWFWDTLVDADLANNAAGWQWIAGCGADAAPYFRVFNPVLQSKKFDPSGDYIRTFVPELKNLPLPYLHAPETAPAEVLRKAGVRLGKTYPLPIVDHAKARELALAAYRSLKD